MVAQPSLIIRFIAFAVNAGFAWFLLARQSSLARGIGWFVAFCALWPLINWAQALIRTILQSTFRTADRIVGISFRTPLGWQVLQPDGESPLILVHATPVDEFSPNINYHLDTSTRDAQGRLYVEIDRTRQVIPTLGLCIPSPKTVGTIAGFQTSATAFMEGRLLRFYWFTLELSRGVLVITFTVPDGHQQTYRGSFHQFISTIRDL